MTKSPSRRTRRLPRWSLAVASFLVLFAACWWVWEAFRLPPADAGQRLAVAIGVATAMATALSGPLFWWAAREEPHPAAAQAANQVVIRPEGPVFGPGSDFRGAELRFVAQPPASVRMAVGQVVVGEIPLEPPAFLAREALSMLEETAGSGQAAVVFAVTGLRGVGKTQLAAAYARTKIREGWGLVGWVNAQTRDTLLPGLARIADRLEVSDPHGDSLESARRLRDYLESQEEDGLLIFDNATDPDRLRPFIPVAGRIQVVITSTDLAFTDFGVTVEVAEFSRAESIEYLQKRTGLSDDPGAEVIADELGSLPLALSQAAATIVGQHLTYQSYMERLRRVPVRELMGRAPGSDYPRSAAEALLLSIDSAESGDLTGLTGRVLRVMAVLSPEGVSRTLLAGLADGCEPTESSAALDAAIERCVTGSLLTWSVTGDQCIMHPLVGRVLRERDQASDRWRSTVSTALRLLELRMYAAGQDWAGREELTHLVAQVEALWAVSVADLISDGKRPRMMRQLRIRIWMNAERQLRARVWALRYLSIAADHSRAIDLGSRILADCEWIMGDSSPAARAARNNLASAYQSAGRLSEAISLYERGLAESERSFIAPARLKFIARNNLASAYKDAGRFDEAIRLYEKILARSKWALRANPYDRFTLYNNLATAYEAVGRTAAAIALEVVTLAGREKILGPNHPDTLSARSNLAAIYESAGRHDEAISLYEQTLADSKRVLSADHPDMLMLRSNLAGAYESAGRHDEAISLYEQTIADNQQMLTVDNPHKFVSLSNLAHAYQSAGRIGEAVSLFEQTLTDCERALGPDNLHTLNLKGNLADAYQSAGRTGEAVSLFEQTVTDCERALGTDHPYTRILRKRCDRARNESGPSAPAPDEGDGKPRPE